VFSEGLTGSRNFQEIKFGDNDTLSAITSSMVHADYLFLLTDVDGLYSSNPRKDPDAKFLEVVSSVAEARLEGKEPAKTLFFVIVLSPSAVYSWTLFHRPRFVFLSPFPPSSLFSRLNKTQLTVKPTLHLLVCPFLRLSPPAGILVKILLIANSTNDDDNRKKNPCGLLHGTTIQ